MSLLIEQEAFEECSRTASFPPDPLCTLPPAREREREIERMRYTMRRDLQQCQFVLNNQWIVGVEQL